MKGELLKYKEQTKAGKLQIIAFIRKVYNNGRIHIREIINDKYQAILEDGKLTGVAYKL